MIDPFRRLRGVLTQEGLSRWANSPKKSLGGRCPINLVEEEPELLEWLINQILENLEYQA